MQRISKMNWSALKHEYDLDAKRLLPWDGMRAPFGGAWCVVRPHTRSLPHGHEENELFICVSGKARIVLDGDHLDVEKGDVVLIAPSTHHYVDNATDEDFHMYSIWWDGESARAFLDGPVLETKGGAS